MGAFGVITAAARCHGCSWAITGSWPDVDRQAERHTKAGPPHHHRSEASMSNPHGIAVYSACTPCASEWLPNAEECEPGRWMGISHASHAPELLALGWIRTADPDGGPDDVTCLHYHLKHWEGGHDSSCCGMDGG